MRVGITIALKENDSIWKNGINQNVLMFYQVIEQIKEVRHVSILQIGSLAKVKDLDFLKEYNLDEINHSNLDYIRDNYDLIISLGAMPNVKWIEEFKKDPNNRYVMYKGGNQFINSIEMIIYGQFKGWPNIKGNKAPAEISKSVDQVWMVPQQEFHNKQYFEIIYDAPATVVPFVWSDYFIKEYAKKYEGTEFTPYYTDKKIDDWIWTSFEPNMSILKNMMPIIYSYEHAYNTSNNKDKFKKLIVTNAAGHRENEDLIFAVKDLNVYKDKKIAFDARFPIVDILSRFSTGVISHQWGNPLNYAYLDAVYFGFPLVHNAELCKDLGYYYDGWKVKDAGDIILNIMQGNHDAKEYTKDQRNKLKRYTKDNKDMIEQYRSLILNLWNKTIDLDDLKYNPETNLLE